MKFHLSPCIPGIDIQRGITMTGGKMEIYCQILVIFCKDAEERLPLLQTIPAADALPDFITQVHALKSASASIGAAEVSARAAKLEAAGRAKDLALIGKELPAFAELLAKLTKGIRAWEAAVKKSTSETAGEQSLTAAMPLLRELAAALESQKPDKADRILDELSKKPLDANTKAALEQISNYILIAEFESALEIITGVIS